MAHKIDFASATSATTVDVGNNNKKFITHANKASERCGVEIVARPDANS